MKGKLLLTLFCLLFDSLSAQTNPAIPTLVPPADTSSAPGKIIPDEPLIQLKPLPELLETAMQNAPLMKVNAVDIAFETTQAQLEKRNWADWFSIGAGTFYGNGAALNTSTDAGVVTYLPTTRRSTNLNLNFNFNLPGGDVLNKRQRVQLAKLDIERKNNDRLEIARNVRLQVTEVYCRAETAIRMLRLKSEAVENLRMAVEVGENFFRAGTLKVSEYSELLERLNHAVDELETQKGEAKRFCLLLQELVGAPVTK